MLFWEFSEMQMTAFYKNIFWTFTYLFNIERVEILRDFNLHEVG